MRICVYAYMRMYCCDCYYFLLLLFIVVIISCCCYFLLLIVVVCVCDIYPTYPVLPRYLVLFFVYEGIRCMHQCIMMCRCVLYPSHSRVSIAHQSQAKGQDGAACPVCGVAYDPDVDEVPLAPDNTTHESLRGTLQQRSEVLRKRGKQGKRRRRQEGGGDGPGKKQVKT